MKTNFRLQQRGFSLVEVLVASVILFSAIASVTMIYRGAFISSKTAEGHVELAGVLPSILSVIRQDIRNQGALPLSELSNQGNAWGVDYQWQATQQSFLPPQPVFSPDSGRLEEFPAKYKLWQVSLILSKDKLHKQYQFNEVSWHNE